MASPPPQAVATRKRPTTSSERGRRFREREREQVQKLEAAVAELKQEVADKEFLKSVWEAKFLRSRHTKFGSLIRLTEEYYSILRYGVTGSGDGSASQQQLDSRKAIEFLSAVTHPEAILGDVVGPDNMIDQWRRYTCAHSQFETQIYDLEIVGCEEDPVVFARLLMHTRITRKTFEMLFPHELSNEPLVQFLIGKKVTYPGTTMLRFSPGMQLVYQSVQLSFVSGFLSAGARIDQVSQIMERSAISSTCTIMDTREERRRTPR